MAIRLTEDKTSLIKTKLTAVMPQENLEAAVSFFKSHANLENKIDWNKNGLSLATDIQRLMAQTSENRAAQDAEKSKLDDNLLYEDDNFALYAIKSYDEAVFADSAKAFGCSAKWCIGYRDDDQYWRKYTINDGEAFAMLVNKHVIRGFSYKSLSSKDKSGKLAGGKYLSVGSMELQIPVFEKMRNSWFVDAGSATNDYSNHDDFYVGVGTGIRYISPVGLIKFDIGFGVSETSIPFHLHFGIGPDL